MRRERNRSFRVFKRLLLWFCAIGFIILPGVISWYGIYLNGIINEEFNTKRWNLPSRIYSEVEKLYPGYNVNQRNLKGKLERIGYQQKSILGIPGEYTITPSQWDIYLKDFYYPDQPFKGFRLRIKLDEKSGIIKGLSNLENGQKATRVEIEPELLGTIFDEELEDRTWVSLEEVPPHLISAVLSIEDSRFYGHPGVDPIGILRALVVNLWHGERLQGGSTLTQQLIKNVLAKREKTLFRKVNEVCLALLLETKYSKDEILELYLNQVYLGQQGATSISGVKEGARYYFSKEVRYISVAESALLAGLLKSPNTYSPFQDSPKAKTRRDLVLKQMLDDGKISEEVYNEAVAEPLSVKAELSLTKYKKKRKQAPYFVDFVIEQLKSKYPYETLQTRGYKIYTMLDMNSQNQAEESLKNGLAKLQKKYKFLDDANSKDPLQGCLLLVESQTGFIRALVGGKDYELSQFNRVVQAKRQPGSLFKPFVYLTAVDPSKNKIPYTLNSAISDLPLEVKSNGKIWSPENYDKTSRGIIPLREALEHSYNIATARLAMDVGLEKVIQTAHSLGVKSPLEPVPSLSLGVFEMTPLELITMYTVIGNLGIKREPLSIRYIANLSKQVIETNESTPTQVIPPQVAYQVHTMLEGAMIRGTARDAVRLGFKGPGAGKTGTTNDFKDAWFIGYTPEFLALVWVGHDQGEPIKLKGSEAALPIWVDLMKKVATRKGSKTFKIPPGGLTLVANAKPDCASTPGCIQESSEANTEEAEIVLTGDKNTVSTLEDKSSVSAAEVNPSSLSSIPTPSTSSGPSIPNLLICAAVQNREPTDCSDRFTRDQGRIYVWMKVSDAMPPITLKHVYYHNGNRDGEVNLPIQYETARTWSSRDITSEGTAGEWTIAVTNEAGEVLATKNFVVE
jgi:penicillin-binding protein 1B